MARCLFCDKESIIISGALGACADCIRRDFKTVSPHIEKVHAESRKKFGLPVSPPRDPEGIQCRICVNECRIPEGGIGYCGARRNEGGRLLGGTPDEGNLEWYYDSLPTNCVADWVCPGGTGAGYPEYSYTKGPEFGYKNLAVFYNACSLNCLFCQNWQWREHASRKKGITADELANCVVDEYTSCICYFGGDPTPQLPHAIRASRLALKNKKGKILRICWETNGTMNPVLLEQMAELSLKTGGCIKFDLKSYDEGLNIALTGLTNRRTIENFERLAVYIKQRPDPPFLVASTLLVPGYVDYEEVENLARFIASIDRSIPYSLLGFYPHFYMKDLPTTSRAHALRARDIARSAGLKRVRVGNIHLLGKAY
jgi:pyruvate formate lyase activating enzyme